MVSCIVPDTLLVAQDMFICSLVCLKRKTHIHIFIRLFKHLDFEEVALLLTLQPGTTLHAMRRGAALHGVVPCDTA